MKHFAMFLSLVVLTATASFGRADSSRTDINPALTYYQAFNVRPELSDGDRDYIFTNEWHGQRLPDRLDGLLARYDNTFLLARQAARSTVPCDWGIDWSKGPYTLLPHLARIKSIALVGRLRVMWELQQGRQSDARDDLLAAVAAGRNGALDGSLISALVQTAVERIACETVAENFNHFLPETLQQIADGLNGPPQRGTIAACMPLETAGFPNWLVARLQELQKQYPNDDAKVLEIISDVFASSGESPDETNHWPQMVKASRGTSAGMIKLIQDLLPLYSRLTEIEALPVAQYEPQMQQFTADFQKSNNPFAYALLPALEKCRPKEFTILSELAMVQAAVAYKLHGVAAFQNVIDPSGQGPFTLQRFVFNGVDRGFELNSPYAGQGFQTVLIFAESDGPPFVVDGKRAGQAASQ